MTAIDHRSATLACFWAVALGLQGAIFIPQPKVSLTAQECLAKRNEAGDVHDRVWSEVAKLETIEVEKAMKEGVNWKV